MAGKGNFRNYAYCLVLSIETFYRLKTFLVSFVCHPNPKLRPSFHFPFAWEGVKDAIAMVVISRSHSQVQFQT